MSLNIEEYALLSDRHTAALVGRDGSIDWLCMPRFDSPSMFGALLGDENHGRWLLAPEDPDATASRSYIEDTFVLTTRWTTPTGVVDVTEFMPLGDDYGRVVRRVHGVSGTVKMRQRLTIRFGYATAMPWVRQVLDDHGHGLLAVAGPDAIILRGPRLHATDHHHEATTTIAAGQTVDSVLACFRSHVDTPEHIDIDAALASTVSSWSDWVASCNHSGPYHDEVIRSLLVLRALSHVETGGIVAAATTSLPEDFGGSRNWDYRYVWLRDASLTLSALLEHAYVDAAQSWRNWLLRAIAGDPNDVQIMYGLAGERFLEEREIPSLPGYQGASPVRVGNDAVGQFQADVIGEVMVALHQAREAGVAEDAFSWPLQRALLSFIEKNWRRPDQGIWEIRGPQREFTHSRVMVWAALDRAIRAVRDYGLPGPVDRWERLRDQVREDVENNGFDEARNSYTQYFGTDQVDASLLVLAQVGYCEPDDPRMLGTVAAIEEDLLRDGLLLRYRTDSGLDGLPPGEHAFLACSFWLAEQYARSGRLDDAHELMDRLVGFANDVGLLSEEYDTGDRRQAGNFPQAFSHLALVQAADAIAAAQTVSTKAPTGPTPAS
ncbi:glycoside hydrolase family 15 protein [Homoserinimonas sp. OAct 916]|uniref:glycoside hydrolase family 15 protein n=1 Tax=Homoserinimonas sp. OAct 916 TaxID=2211450 RepID=UPI000DBE455C|nr:glycoside hydrolase family 15 protein [Homoserinimonas sp. OAct 916]